MTEDPLRDTDDPSSQASGVSPALETRQRGYTVIVGHGRSGTNWIMDMLDTSPLTHCRSEPNVIPGSPFLDLPKPWLPKELQTGELESHWDRVVAWAASHVGERDHPVPGRKLYIHELSRRSGVASLPSRSRRRRLLAPVVPRFREPEWHLPWWLGSQRLMESSYLVLKLNKATGWASWLLERRPHVPVIHIVRHPGGRLNSWRNRYLSRSDAAETLERNRNRLKQVERVSREWAHVLPDIDRMNLAETETWFWRYATETLHAVGDGQANYRLVIYEELVADPVGVARDVYELCDLRWTPEVERSVRSSGARSRSIADAWRDELSPDDAGAVERILAGSLAQDWWSR